jgi:hypothetical protein
VRAEFKAARVVVVVWSVTSWAERWSSAEAQTGFERSILMAARLSPLLS